ncbi:MAG: hypothetical protein KKD73_13085 [Proteobacteria bacterium]|nr:hypothetical protein [Pseudomonadota bacterium]MBU1639879.1 hypothetical protein [Pseudomonadota bacterium]
MPRLIDTTQREGEQTPGLHLCLAAKIQLFTGLTRTGVVEIELGMANAANLDLAELVCPFPSGVGAKRRISDLPALYDPLCRHYPFLPLIFI